MCGVASVIAQESIPLMPLTDPQRFSQFKDNLTQAILKDEDQIMKTAYQDEATGRTQAYNDNVKGNNVMVCLDAAHNGDNFTAQTACDGLYHKWQATLRREGSLVLPPPLLQVMHCKRKSSLALGFELNFGRNSYQPFAFTIVSELRPSGNANQH